MNGDSRKGKILVVDDDARLADLVVEYLTRIGYHAVAAYGGNDGLKRFRDDDFRVVITDMRMPDMGGIELLKAVKATRRDVIVIIVTAFSTIDSAVDAIRKGAFDFISKPFDLNALKEIIDRAFTQGKTSRLNRLFKSGSGTK